MTLFRYMARCRVACPWLKMQRVKIVPTASFLTRTFDLSAGVKKVSSLVGEIKTKKSVKQNGIQRRTRWWYGVFLVTTKARLFPWYAFSVCTHIYEFQPSYNGVCELSEPVIEASERSKCSKAERCGESEGSERCEQTNIASDRVARLKRDCPWQETRP